MGKRAIKIKKETPKCKICAKEFKYQSLLNRHERCVHLFERIHLGERIAEVFHGTGHLLRLTAGLQLCLLQQPKAAGELMHHLLTPGLKLCKPAA